MREKERGWIDGSEKRKRENGGEGEERARVTERAGAPGKSFMREAYKNIVGVVS